MVSSPILSGSITGVKAASFRGCCLLHCRRTHLGKPCLCYRVALGCGSLVPHQCRCWVALYPNSPLVAIAHILLGDRNSLVRCRLIELKPLYQVLAHAMAGFVEMPEIELGETVVLIGSQVVPLQG